jgi:hypothetical protein
MQPYATLYPDRHLEAAQDALQKDESGLLPNPTTRLLAFCDYAIYPAILAGFRDFKRRRLKQHLPIWPPDSRNRGSQINAVVRCEQYGVKFGRDLESEHLASRNTNTAIFRTIPK